jgi:thiol:disulfide interchange protein
VKGSNHYVETTPELVLVSVC